MDMGKKSIAAGVALGIGAAVMGTSAFVSGASAMAIKSSMVWTFDHASDTGGAATAAEILAHDKENQRIFVAGVTGVDVLDAQTGARVDSIPLDTNLFSGVNSVAVRNGVVAIAAAAANAQQPGSVLIYDAGNLAAPPTNVAVGENPDMVTFNASGTSILVANEGEPNDAYTDDPVSSVSVIDVATKTAQTAGFGAFNAQAAALAASGVRIFGPGASVAQDLEPEYIAVSPDGTRAWVTLQENNALAIVDLTGPAPVVSEVVPLGFKDHGQPGNGLDPSDRNGGMNIDPYANLFGMYQPDAIASFAHMGQTYLITANEGDARDYGGFSEEERVKDLTLSAAFPSNAGDDDQLGRLNVTTTLGESGGEYSELYVYGTRSFSILDEDGNLLFDSGDLIEQILAAQFPDLWDEGRNDNKGPEPESVVVGEIDGHRIAFLGLERTEEGSAIMAFNISDPLSPFFMGLVFSEDDVSPEGLIFISSGDSFDGNSYLGVSNEVSGTTTLFEVSVVPEPEMAALFGLGLLGIGVGRRLRLSDRA